VAPLVRGYLVFLAGAAGPVGFLALAAASFCFFAAESCGKCTPCREGTVQLLHIVDEIIAGHGKASDIDKLERLSKAMIATSFCGLGQAAPNPLLSSLRHFRYEWDAHLAGKCPAARCSGGICREEDAR